MLCRETGAEVMMTVSRALVMLVMLGLELGFRTLRNLSLSTLLALSFTQCLSLLLSVSLSLFQNISQKGCFRTQHPQLSTTILRSRLKIDTPQLLCHHIKPQLTTTPHHPCHPQVTKPLPFFTTLVLEAEGSIQ